ACQECVDGRSCTAQSNFTPCGDDVCTWCQDGFCAKRLNGTGCGNNSRCRDGVCTPNPPTCSDGLKNGNESDTDCGGGTCPRCAIGKTCVVPTDCTSNVCTNHTCACIPVSNETSGPATCETNHPEACCSGHCQSSATSAARCCYPDGTVVRVDLSGGDIGLCCGNAAHDIDIVNGRGTCG